MTTLKDIARLRRLTKEAGLENAEILDKYTDRELVRDVYNGIGPESFPVWLRKLVNALNPSLEPVALIHDAEWHETDHTEESWQNSNKRFRTNGIRMAKFRYGWWNILRYRVMRQASLFSKACGTHAGWVAWNAGDRCTHVREADR